MPRINMIALDSAKLEAFLKGKDLNEISTSIGKDSGYMSHIRARLKMPVAVYRLLCRTYDLVEDALTPDPPKPKPVPSAPEKPVPSAPAIGSTSRTTATTFFCA